ncbi:hypothetical protein ACLOJK_000731 [Asimina triloba]
MIRRPWLAGTYVREKLLLRRHRFRASTTHDSISYAHPLRHARQILDLVEIVVSTMAGNDRIDGFVSILRQFADSAKEGKSADEALFSKTCTDAVTFLLSSQSCRSLHCIH